MNSKGALQSATAYTHPLRETMALLARTPAVLDALLRDLPEFWTHRNEGDNSWNAFDVVAHLIHSERSNWMARVTLILQSGGARPFEPFDRWAHQQQVQDKSLNHLLNEFELLRTHNLEELRALNLGAQQLALCGEHPTFGTVRLSELLATWAAHDLTHLHQLSRIMAHQYREAVGPWSKFLGVMHCAGHSD